MRRSSTASQCVNLHPGKSAHLLITNADAVLRPLVIAISDLHHSTIHFAPVETTKIDDYSAFVRFKRVRYAPPAPAPAPAVARKGSKGAKKGKPSRAATTTPTDGLLSITLIDEDPLNPGTGDLVDVADTPVDYIDDPNAP